MRRLLLVLSLAACGKSSGSTGATKGGAKWYDADAPVGVWVGTDIGTDYDPNNFHQHMKLQGYAFWPDGHLTRSLPASGFADFDRDEWERGIGTNASLGGEPGTYARDGGTWTIKYTGGREVAMKLVEDHLETEKARVFRAKDVTGATLDGTYTWYTNAEDESLAGLGCKPVVAFTADGHFDDRGGFATPCTSSGPDAPGTGTYELRDFSLVMHYSDGRTVRHLITPVVNGDLRADNSRALIMYRVWARRSAPIAAAEPPAPMQTAPPAASSDDTTFDGVVFATPPGQVQRSSSTITFTEATNDQLQCMTIVYAGVASTGDAKRDFAADWKDVMLNGRTADASPAPDAAQSPHGLVFTVAGSMTTETSNHVRVYRALFVFEVDGRRVDAMLIAPTEAGLAQCNLQELIKSIRPAN